MHNHHALLLVLSACLGFGCASSAVDLGDSSISGWIDTPSAADPTRPLTLFHGRAQIFGITADETRLYALLGHESGNGELVTCPIERCGSARVTLASLPPSSIGFIGHTRLVLLADRLYWLVSSGSPGFGVASCPLTGCAAPDLVPSPTRSEIAGDGEHVYWVDDQDRLMRLGPDMSEPQVARDLGTLFPDISTLTVQGDYAYLVERGAAIHRVRKDGSQAPEVVASGEHITGVSTTSEVLYYSTSSLAGSIARCPLAGCAGQSLVIATNQRWPSAIQLDHEQAFWLGTVQPFAVPFTHATLSGCSLPDCSMLRMLAKEFPSPDKNPTHSVDADLDGWMTVNRGSVLWVEGIPDGPGSALRRLPR